MTALDQAFIKAYKHPRPTGQSAPTDEISSASATDVKSDRIEASAASTQSGSSQKHPSPKNEADLLAFAPPSGADAKKYKPVRKRSKKKPRASDSDGSDSSGTVYRLDPPDPKIPDAPRASSFTSLPCVSDAHLSDPGKNLRLDGPAQDAPPPRRETSAAEKGFYPGIRVFQPMLQVDYFAWPNVCHRLESVATEELDRLAEAILSAAQQGKKVLGICGAERGEGATTLLLCAARRLAARSVKTVIIDADLDESQLAKHLGLLPQLGWEHVAAGQQPLEEVLIESTADNLAVLPLCGPLSVSEISFASRRLMAEGLDTLRNNYDVILMDLGPLENPKSIIDVAVGGLNCRIDAIIMVRKEGKMSPACSPAVRQSLAAAGIPVAGVIENFVQNSKSSTH